MHRPGSDGRAIRIQDMDAPAEAVGLTLLHCFAHPHPVRFGAVYAALRSSHPPPLQNTVQLLLMDLPTAPLCCYCFRSRICNLSIPDRRQKVPFPAPLSSCALLPSLRAAVKCRQLRRSKTEPFLQQTEGCAYAVQPPDGTAPTAVAGRVPGPRAVAAGCTIRQSHSFFQTEQFHFAASPIFYEAWSAQAAVFQPTRLLVPGVW